MVESNIPTPLTRKGSHAEMVENSVSSQTFWVVRVFFWGGGERESMRRSQNLEKKKLHKALRSVLFLASFISF